MKMIKAIVVFFLLAQSALMADELTRAYEKEYAFLKAQKIELEKRLSSEKKEQDKNLEAARVKVQSLQNRYVALSETLKNEEIKIEKAQRQLEDKQGNSEMISGVIEQANIALSEYDVTLPSEKKASQSEIIQSAFNATLELYKKLSSITSVQGKFYLENGAVTEGEIIKVGNIAAYGISDKASGALAPAGNGEYKMWNQPTASDAKAMQAQNMTKELNIFVYENLDKEIEYAKEKTFAETIEGGGTIGYIILGMGALGLFLLVLRVALLLNAGTNVKQITEIVINKVESGKKHDALAAIENFKGSTARVIRSALRNIDKDREHIEDVVTESILNESSAIDRFGNFVLVLAAVAPLMGLLGTVTGMIATFDVITEHGTGDPKMLSGGISEALVTTMLGLIVAIPLLLVGNLLSGWARSIKDSMEQSALHIVNLYAQYK